MPNDPELGEGWAPVKLERKPDYIYEGLCAAVFVKRWRDVRGMDKGRTQKAAKELRLKGLDPLDPKVVDEIQRRAQRWRQINERTPKYMGKLDNPVLLAGDWRLCECEATIQPGQPSRKEQAERDAKLRREHGAAWAWWGSLSTSERLAKLNRWSPGTPTGHVVLHEFDRKE